MFAAHFAAGLAIGGRESKAPISALLAGVFLPDLIWIALAFAGVEPSGPSVFFDGWSHSFLSVATEATVFASFFALKGLRVWLSIWFAVLSHFALDAIIHPRPLELYPHARVRIPWNLWRWGAKPTPFGPSHYWWVQFFVVTILLGVYVLRTRRSSLPTNLAAATVLLVFGLHWLL